jgi:sugar phosphate isomerase/epimerase
MPLGHNRVLGDPAKPEAARPHRVALANWPATMKDKRTETLDSLLSHLAAAGYEGTEFGPSFWARWFPGDSPVVIARHARAALEKRGLANFGSTLHVTDDAMRKLNWLDWFIEQMKLVRELGGGFASYQVVIHPDYEKSGGSYREDERYLRWCAANVADLRDATWEQGLNFYLEVHVDRITEDPAALCRILDMAACELNGDMSHYLARGFMRGRHVERIQRHIGHTHVRMARMYGDLSAGVIDPKTDWEAGGVTWQMFQYMMPALKGGLSSRTISGETGPMHLVKDTLTQDAALVPLYRAMARWADASAQGIQIKVAEPADLKPWG